MRSRLPSELTWEAPSSLREQSTNCWAARTSPIPFAPRHRPDHRRCLRDRACGGQQGPRAPREPGLDNRLRAPHRNPGAGRTGPDDVTVDRGVGHGRYGRRRDSIDVAEIYAPFTHQRLKDPHRGHRPSGRDEGRPVRRPAGGQPDVLGGVGAHRLCRAAHFQRLSAARTGARHERSCAATESRRGPGRKKLWPVSSPAVLGTGQTKYVAKRQDVSMNGLVREAIDRALADSG